MIHPKPVIWQRARGLVPLIGAACVAGMGAVAWPYTVDDAYIVARYAARIVHGQGYGFSAAATPSDGITGPLWLVPALFAELLGADSIVAAKLVGLVCMALAYALVLQRLARRFDGARYVLCALLLTALQPSAGSWGVAGLETGAATLALVVATLAALARPRPLLIRAGCAIAILAWLRPELAFASVLLLIVMFARVGPHAKRALYLALCGAGSVLAFRLALFHAPLPLSFFAKPAELGNGARHVGTALLVLCGGFGLILPSAAWSRGRHDDRAIVALLAVHALAVLLAGGDWMPGFRLFAPVLPLYIAVASVGAVRLWRGKLRVAVAGLALGFACLVPLTDLITRVPELRAAEQSREHAGRLLADTLRTQATRVALVDIGYLGLRSGIEVIDLAGLTDPEIAHLPGGHLSKHIDDALLVRRDPDAIVLHSARRARVDAAGQLLGLFGYPVEERVARSAWVRAQFRVARQIEYAPGYEYVLLLRRAVTSR